MARSGSAAGTGAGKRDGGAGAPEQQRLSLPHSLKGSTASHAELVKRLTGVHEQLQDFEQDHVDTSSLDAAARQLVDPTLLLHKDKTVKALVAACLVDVLRLYAPEAPYTPAQLYDLFEFLTNQLKYAGDPRDPNQPEHFYVLDSLASVKSIVLVCDLDQADQLLARIFSVVFETVSSATPKNVTLALSDILLALLDEAASIPTGVIDAITTQFISRSHRSGGGGGKGKDRADGAADDDLAHERRAAFRLAVDVARAASDKLQRYVSQYFSEVVLASVNGGTSARGKGRGDSDDEDDEQEASEASDQSDSDDDGARGKGGRGKRKAKTRARAKLSKDSNFAGGSRTESGEYASLAPRLVDAHRLIRSLNRHVPALLLNVIPQLAEELTSSETILRTIATDFLGQMLGEPVGHGDLARSNPAVWKDWMQRARDKDPKVRIKMCDRLGAIWREHPELATDIEAVWTARLLQDADEKVRLAACSVIDGTDYEVVKHDVSRRALGALADRLSDRKERVRAVAFRILGQLYNSAFVDIDGGDEAAYDQFGWIPSRVVDVLATGDGQAGSALQRTLVLQTLSDHILPLPDEKDVEDTVSWTDRFLLVESSLQTVQQRNALMSVTHLSDKLENGVWTNYLSACQKYNGGLVDDKDTGRVLKEYLKRSIDTMSTYMPEPDKARQDLETFSQENEAQLYRELRVMLDPQTDLKAFVKNKRDFLKRVGKFKSAGDSVANTFAYFIRLACYIFINRSSVPQLLKRAALMSRDEPDALSQSARRVLDYITRSRPVLYRAHVAELARMLNDASLDRDVHHLALHALVKLKRAAGETFTVDAKVAKRALELAKGKDEGLAKQGATLVALDESRPDTAKDLVEYLADQLDTATDEEVVPLFAALARLAREARDAFETKSDTVLGAALTVLTRPGGDGEAVQDEEMSWFEDDQLPVLTQARALAVKILVNRCLAYAKTADAARVAKPVFDILWPLLNQFGGGQDTYSPPVSARIRLAAAFGLLKLLTSSEPAYLKAIIEPSRFEALSRLCQDTTFEVRDAFLRKTVAYLRAGRFVAAVTARLNMILFLVAHEPEDELKELVFSFARARRRLPEAERQPRWELPFARLIHLLARHPDLDMDADEVDPEIVKLFAKYIEEYLEIFTSAENISFLFNLAMRVKTGRDKEDSRYDRNLYLLSELSQYLIKAIGHRHNWPIPTYPGQVTLPPDLFEVITDPDERREILKRTYLEEAILDKIETRPEKKRVVGVTKKRAATAPANGDEKPKKRAKASPTAKRANGQATKRKANGAAKKKVDRWVSDDEEEEDETSEEESGSGSDAEIVARLTPGRAGKTSGRGQRGGLRSDQGKKLRAGLGEDESEDDQMQVDGGDHATTTASAKKNKSAASPRAQQDTPKKRKNAAAAASTAASRKNGKKTGAVDDKPRQARKKLAEPRKLKEAVATEELSDVGDSDDGEEKEDDSDSALASS